MLTTLSITTLDQGKFFARDARQTSLQADFDAAANRAAELHQAAGPNSKPIGFVAAASAARVLSRLWTGKQFAHRFAH